MMNIFDYLKAKHDQHKRTKICRKNLEKVKEDLLKAQSSLSLLNPDKDEKRLYDTTVYKINTMLKRTNLCLDILETEDFCTAMPKIQTIFRYIEANFDDLKKQVSEAM